RCIRQFSSTRRNQRKHVDHYATLSIPRNATKAQIKVLTTALSKKYHPDIVKDNTSETKFHAVSEAYAVLCDDRKRREYDRTFDSSYKAYHTPGQHPQATTTRPSQQHSFKHVWPNHPRNRTRDSMGSYPNAARYDHLHEHARASNSGSRIDPFMNPLVQRATGR
ncbi:DnaJ domain-containing protein, partial [Boletus edulis]